LPVSGTGAVLARPGRRSGRDQARVSGAAVGSTGAHRTLRLTGDGRLTGPGVHSPIGPDAPLRAALVPDGARGSVGVADPRIRRPRVAGLRDHLADGTARLRRPTVGARAALGRAGAGRADRGAAGDRADPPSVGSRHAGRSAAALILELPLIAAGDAAALLSGVAGGALGRGAAEAPRNTRAVELADVGAGADLTAAGDVTVAAVLRRIDGPAVGEHVSAADVAGRIARIPMVAAPGRPAASVGTPAKHGAIGVRAAATAALVVGAPGPAQPAACRGLAYRRSRARVDADPRAAGGAPGAGFPRLVTAATPGPADIDAAPDAAIAGGTGVTAALVVAPAHVADGLAEVRLGPEPDLAALGEALPDA